MLFNLQKKGDYHTYLVLRRKLNGYDDLAKKIVNIKNEDLLNDIKNDYIERDFYNWLNCDILIRHNLVMTNDNSVDDDLNQIYYHRNYKLLGLEPYDKNDIYNSLRRNCGLTECFKKDWWKSTEKSRLKWELIHKSIKCVNNNEIFIWKLERDYESDDIINFNNDHWRKPKHVEKCIINNNLLIYKLFINIDGLFDGDIYINGDLKMII